MLVNQLEDLVSTVVFAAGRHVGWTHHVLIRGLWLVLLRIRWTADPTPKTVVSVLQLL